MLHGLVVRIKQAGKVKRLKQRLAHSLHSPRAAGVTVFAIVITKTAQLSRNPA